MLARFGMPLVGVAHTAWEGSHWADSMPALETERMHQTGVFVSKTLLKCRRAPGVALSSLRLSISSFRCRMDLVSCTCTVHPSHFDHGRSRPRTSRRRSNPVLLHPLLDVCEQMPQWAELRKSQDQDMSCPPGRRGPGCFSSLSFLCSSSCRCNTQHPNFRCSMCRHHYKLYSALLCRTVWHGRRNHCSSRKPATVNQK